MDVFAPDVSLVRFIALGLIELEFKCVLHALDEAFCPRPLEIVQRIRALPKFVANRVAVPF